MLYYAHLYSLNQQPQSQDIPLLDFLLQSLYQQMLQGLFKVKRFYRQPTYSKLKITRQQNQSSIIFIKNETTVSTFIDQIRKQFKLNEQRQIIISSVFESTLLNMPVPIQARKAASEVFGPQPFIPLLLNGEIYMYEAEKSVFALCYGIELEEFNMTNNRNLPQRISYGIIDLNDQWLQAKTIGDALNQFPQINPTSEAEMEDKNELQNAILKAHNHLVNIEDIKKQPFLGNPTTKFVKMMLGMMSLNWAFLFAVTYGKYGWDVGEPLSYLTSIGVDLLALMGLFNLNTQLQNNLSFQQNSWYGKLNLQSQKKLNSWLISYYRRQLY